MPGSWKWLSRAPLTAVAVAVALTLLAARAQQMRTEAPQTAGRELPTFLMTPVPAAPAAPARLSAQAAVAAFRRRLASAHPTTSPSPRPSPRPLVVAASPRPAVVRSPAVRPPAARATETLEARARRLLGTLRYDWAALGYTVSFLPGQRGWLGLTNPHTKEISVYVRSGQTDQQLLVTLAHEIGHAVDFTYTTFARQAEYLALRGIAPSSVWLPCEYCSDYDSPAGDFAEVFAVWLVGSQDFLSRMAPRPSAVELAVLQHLFLP